LTSSDTLGDFSTFSWTVANGFMLIFSCQFLEVVVVMTLKLRYLSL
jgi:hypothetical protein